jgi:UDP-GlcNAc:undecaprenyl-phosphate GlcNAc-1-phosphate transferase
VGELASFGAAFLTALLLTPVVIQVARRTGKVALPRADRWHSKPTALLGGIGIFLAFLVGTLAFIELPHQSVRLRVAGVLVGATMMFVLGLVDDLIQIKPGSKLLGQILAACVLVYTGVYFDILGMPLLTIPLTVFFVVGITNAFNLLDNMDGLASGVAAICVLTIFVFHSMMGTPQAIGVLCLALAGSLVGFLVFNFNPARIFMGDSGSMFIGFTVAAVSILGTWEQASNTFLILAVPVMLLGLPIFDTTYVTVVRTLSGRPVSHGGRDHTSHQLVRLGLSERRTVSILYGICAVFGLIAVLSLKLGIFGAGVIGILALTTVSLFGVFLAQDRIYHAESKDDGAAAGAARRSGTRIETFVMYKMRIAEVFIDMMLCGAAYVAANLIRFEGQISGHVQSVMIYSLPIVIAVKLVCFWAFGLYRRMWKFAGIHDLIAVAKAVFTASLISVFVLWVLTRLEGYSRAVFVLDGILLLVFAAGSRVMLRVFRESFLVADPGARRLAIFGAGAAGELLLRELRSNPALGYRAVAFFDDDPGKAGRRIHGVRIRGGRDALERVVRELEVDEIVVAIPSLDETGRKRLERLCRRTGLPCRQMKPVSTTFLDDPPAGPRAVRSVR